MNKRLIKCPFGLLNIGGLMKSKPIMSSTDATQMIGYEITTPLFCHETYKVKPTFNRNINRDFAIMISDDDSLDGKYYQKKFRRMVTWDFGDGHKHEGYSVEHYYSKPGRYRISCTFYDINRCAWKNEFFIEVVVKEVLPTKLSFVKAETKTEVKCSKIEKITELESMLSINCKEDLKVQAERIFTADDIKGETTISQEVNRNYTEIPDEILKFTRKYWTFLENEQQLVFQSEKIYGDNLKPKSTFSPNYIDIYGKFKYNKDDTNNPIELELYQVIPYLNIDEKLKTIRVLNPNCNLDNLLVSTDTENNYNLKYTKLITIQQKYTKEQLPKDAVFIGKRGFVDIFYKNDYLTPSNKENVFSFHFDIEDKNITKELLSSDNYLNMNPLGMSLRVVSNTLSNVRIGVSLDGFLRQDNGDDWTKEAFYFDPYLKNGLIKGINIDFYIFPYIEYDYNLIKVEGTDIMLEEGEDTDFVLSSPMYYVPKDVTFDISQFGVNMQSINGKEGNNSRWLSDRGETIENWLYRTSFALKDYFNGVFNVKLDGLSKKTFTLRKDALIIPEKLTIPTEKMYNQNIKELIETYMSHPMFDETLNIKQFFDIILSGRNLLNYTLTKSGHFLDDYANIRTCYLSSLIQTLKMMGEDIYEYEKGAFEGVNELRDFVRILTMNHSDLVGHLVDDDVDTTIRADKFGKNVGDEIFVDDVLTLQQYDNAHNKGKILKLTRDGKVYNMNEIHPNGVDLIVQDKYTNETKVVNLRSVNKGSVSLFEYDHSWGWNLLLPQDFDDCVYRLKQNSEYAATHNGTNLYKTSELNRIKQVMKEILRGYYAFYVLNPNVQKVRKGNFLDENTITSVMDDSEEWEAKWGFTHDVLMKIIRDNGNLINSEVDVEVDENLQRSYGRKTISFDGSSLTGLVETELSNIQTYVYDDGFLSNDAIVNGIVNVYGYICGLSEEYLEVQLENASVEIENSMEQLKTIEPILQLKLKIDENGVIHPSKHVFEVSSKNYTGNLTISLCGKLEKIKDTLKGFLWSVSIDLFKVK